MYKRLDWLQFVSQNTLVQWVWSEKMKTDSNFGNRNRVGYKLCCKNEDIFLEMKFHSCSEKENGLFSLLLSKSIKVKNGVKIFPLRNIKNFSARINLQIENISFYILFSGSEVVFTRIRSFVVWWRIRHRGEKTYKDIFTFRFLQETILTANTDWG